MMSPLYITAREIEAPGCPSTVWPGGEWLSDWTNERGRDPVSYHSTATQREPLVDKFNQRRGGANSRLTVQWDVIRLEKFFLQRYRLGQLWDGRDLVSYNSAATHCELNPTISASCK